MILARFQRLPIRDKLLAMALLPLLVVLPLLSVILLLWSNTAFDRMLIAKIRSDLAVAQGYFERVLGEVGSGTAAIADSHALALALAPGRSPPTDLQALLQHFKSRAGLDFLSLRASDGTLIATDWSAASPAMRATAAPLPAAPPATSAPGAIGAGTPASIEVLEPAELALLAPALRARVAVPLLPTRGAAPTERTQESRAMVVLASHPVHAADGRLLALVQGGVLLNRNLPFIDHINQIVYPEGSLPFGSRGTATLFLDDVRISTNVRLFGPAREERAIGTRVSQAVREAVLGRGSTWLDRAFVVNDWYVSAYQPISDSAQRRVGMLYVGYLEKPSRG